TAKGTETFHFSGSSIGKLLATCIQEEVVKQVGTFNRRVEKANFVVLANTNMHAALVECVFLSNPNEAKLLLDPNFRQNLAQGIFNGLDRYILTSLPRIAGANRYETAARISQEGFTSSSTVVLASGENFPDALAGAPLAYKYHSPLLLTSPTSLNSETKAEIKRLGATQCIILGGTGAVSSSVGTELENMGLKVKRIAGKNRFETASLIAREVGSSTGEAVIVSGLNFPDALAMSSYAAKSQIPILLSRETTLTAETTSTLSLLGIQRTIIAGGKGVISLEVETYLTNNGHNPTRVAGSNRFETSALIAYNYFPLANTAYVATGENFPDALSAACLAAMKNAPIVLVEKEKLPTSVDNYIRAYAANLQGVYLLGGEGPISADVARQICAILYF
ncbi:MAG: cell wall-binding repeat-containing protein, partial [Candidatus Subteraquimicrobiales bacterium]|nr:cell wall-binding repeat-containing protein [Candidatus Subteraquimicrobiales bacterium]